VRMLKFLWLISSYTVALYLLAQHWIVAIFLLVTLIGLIRGERYSTAVWYQIDELAAAVFHFEQHRTVSGIVGEMAYNNRKGYEYLELLVNTLFNDDLHCYNQYIKEMKILKFRETL